MLLMVLYKCDIGTFTYVRYYTFLFYSSVSDEVLVFSSIFMNIVMYDSYLLKDVHSVLVNFPREYAQESMMLYI